MTIKDSLLPFLQQVQMLFPGDRVLCAVSGGADSMCLLHWLFRHAGELGITVSAAHFEHGIRGEESLRDADFVAAWCRDAGVECVVGHGDVPAEVQRTGKSTEEAARDLRYAFLEKTADDLKCNKIATAHNADDNAETVLLNLVRGAGTAGLSGIPPVRGRLIRPLLCVPRSEIEEYLELNHIPHVEDSTNSSDDYSRNLLRHQVLPVLRGMNPSFASAVGRETALLRRDEECLSALANDFLKRHLQNGSIPVDELNRLHPAVASRVVRSIFQKTPSAKHVEQVLALCGGTELASLDLPGMLVRREQGRLYFIPSGQSQQTLTEEKIIPQQLVPGCAAEIPEAGLRLFLSESENISAKIEEINGLFKTYLFKSAAICGNISVTGRYSGDKLRPAGRGCTKTLKQLFLEAGYTQAQRRSVPVIRDEKGILCVAGLAVDERCVPQQGDKVLRLDIFYVNKAEEPRHDRE